MTELNKNIDPILDMTRDNLHIPAELSIEERFQAAACKLRINKLKEQLLKKKIEHGTW